MIINTVYIIMLLLLAVEDIRYRAIEITHLIAMVLIMWGMQLMRGSFDIRNMMTAVVIGVFLMGVGVVTGSMGLADTIIFMATGVFMGCTFAFKVLILSLMLLCVIYTAKYMLGYRVQRKMAFIPYLLAGAVGVMILG